MIDKSDEYWHWEEIAQLDNELIKRLAEEINLQPYWVGEMAAALREKRQLRDETGRSVSDKAVWTHWTPAEYEAQLQRVAKRLKYRYSNVPFHAHRASKSPNYWRGLASSAVFA